MLRGARGASFLYSLPPRAWSCVAVLTGGTDNLPPSISQMVYLVLQTTHVSPPTPPADPNPGRPPNPHPHTIKMFLRQK